MSRPKERGPTRVSNRCGLLISQSIQRPLMRCSAMGRRDNAWRGKYKIWSDYRYGAAKPVTLAPIWNSEKRKSVVSKTMDIMRDWRLSPFEYEGETVAGIRSGLCIAGHGWSRSDKAARDAVEAALHQLGAKRPTWEQGQPDYVERRETCVWCKGELEISRSGSGYKYCSPECARIALQKRDFQIRSTADKTFAAAKLMLERAKQPLITCERCGKSFHPLPRRKQRFCSNYCALHGRAPRPELDHICRFCGRTFKSTAKVSSLCSDVCQRADHLERRGYEFKILKPYIFDHYWSRHHSTARHLEMTTVMFDRLFREGFSPNSGKTA